jgi:isocitrate/isopropylmalate dehydrogenase
MLVGGLGVACSGNIGAEAAIFEPVHGSAPKLVGTQQANPLATFLSLAMMLDYLGESQLSSAVKQSVTTAFKNNQLTPDLGGSLTTPQVTDAIIRGLS